VAEPDSTMPEVWQAEWCPHAHRVRQALTELGVDFVTRQVPAGKDDRDELEAATGGRAIPVVRLPDGSVLSGDTDEMIAALRSRYPEPAGAEAHRQRA
jgi:glutaredoxin